MEHAMIEGVDVGLGILAHQVRAVVEAYQGVGRVAARLGVEPHEARAMAALAGVEIRSSHGGGTPPKVSKDQVRAAVLSEAPLAATARRLGITPAGLHLAARRLGLPTDPAGRAAYRQGEAA